MLIGQFGKTFIENDNKITIAAGQSLSALFDCRGVQPRTLFIPANWTACNISFLTNFVPSTSSTYTKTDVDGTIISIPTFASQELPLLAYLNDASPYMQILCDTPQVSDVVIVVGLQPIYQGVHG